MPVNFSKMNMNPIAIIADTVALIPNKKAPCPTSIHGRDIAIPCARSARPAAAAIIAIETQVSDLRRTARTLMAAAAPPTTNTRTVLYDPKGDRVPVTAAKSSTRRRAILVSQSTAIGRATNVIGSNSAGAPHRAIAKPVPKYAVVRTTISVSHRKLA